MEGGKSVEGHVIRTRYSSVRSTDGDIKTPEARRGSETISYEERALIFLEICFAERDNVL